MQENCWHVQNCHDTRPRITGDTHKNLYLNIRSRVSLKLIKKTNRWK